MIVVTVLLFCLLLSVCSMQTSVVLVVAVLLVAPACLSAEPWFGGSNSNAEPKAATSSRETRATSNNGKLCLL